MGVAALLLTRPLPLLKGRCPQRPQGWVPGAKVRAPWGPVTWGLLGITNHIKTSQGKEMG